MHLLFVDSLRPLSVYFLSLNLHRKEGKDDQLMAAQAYLKLGEVSAESGKLAFIVPICLSPYLSDIQI